MKTPVYDADGKEHLVEAVDAKEMIASGSYVGEPLAPQPEPVRVTPQAPAPREINTLKLPIGKAGIPVSK